MTDQAKPNQLQVILKEQHVPKAQAERLVEAFGGPFNEVGEILADYQTIKVTDVNDQATMTKARVKRLALKKARTTVENKRKELKEAALKEGRAIDSIARFVKETIAPAEQYLQLQEDYAKLEAARKHDEMLAERRERLTKLGANPDLYNYQGLPPEGFDQLVFDIERENKRLAEEAAAAEAERKAKADAAAAEQAQRDLEAKRLRALSALGFAVSEDGDIQRGSYTVAGIKWASAVTMSDKGFDKMVDDAVERANKVDAEEAEARRADQERVQAAAKKQTERLNEITGYGARYDADRDAYVLDTLVVKISQVDSATDEDWANTVALFSKVAAELQEAADKEQAELKAAREREAADKERAAKAEADERAALLAPDKTKLITLADGLEMVRTSKLPALKTKQAQDIVNDIDADLTRLIANIRAKADRLK